MSDLYFSKFWREWKAKAGHFWNGCKYGEISRWMDCFSFQIYCYSALGFRLVWRCPPCLLRSFLLKTGALSLHYRPVCSSQCSGHWMGRNYHWRYSPIVSLIENGIRMLENKQFQKNKRKERKKKSLRMSQTGGRKTKSRKLKESQKDKPKRSRPRYIIIKLSNIKEKSLKKKEKNLPTKNTILGKSVLKWKGDKDILRKTKAELIYHY